MNTPKELVAERPREKWGLTFSEFKKLINGVDEAVWGDRPMYVGDDNQCVVVDLSESSGLPALPAGSSGARFYGVSEGVPPKISIQFMTLRQIQAWENAKVRSK